MTVIITNDTPDRIRGMLKRWFIEPKPNVFVGSVNARTREKTVEYILRNAGDIGMLVISDAATSQGFGLEKYGETGRKPVRISGHHLIAEKWDEKAPC